MLAAFKVFADRHTDAHLYLHTEVTGAYGGLPLPLLMATLGIDPARVHIVPQDNLMAARIPDRAMAMLYSAGDVLLSTSMGEGFGLAVLEAQACGTPVIVTDFTAQPELVGAGWTVAYQRYWDFTQGTFWATPNIEDIVAKLELAYAARGDAELRAKAVDFAQQYDADLVFETHWKPVLAEMEEQLKPREKRQSRRAKNRRRK
jgi:glycosyltransferase involved in cell wall biosynthesis